MADKIEFVSGFKYGEVGKLTKAGIDFEDGHIMRVSLSNVQLLETSKKIGVSKLAVVGAVAGGMIGGPAGAVVGGGLGALKKKVRFTIDIDGSPVLAVADNSTYKKLLKMVG